MKWDPIGSSIANVEIFVNFLKNDTLKELIEKFEYQETTNLAMNNIDEAVILKSEKGVDYINHKGF